MLSSKITFILCSDQSFTVFWPDICPKLAHKSANSVRLNFWKYTPLDAIDVVLLHFFNCIDTVIPVILCLNQFPYSCQVKADTTAPSSFKQFPHIVMYVACADLDLSDKKYDSKNQKPTCASF